MKLPINNVVCGDCVEVMRGFPAESIDMAMFSPPYWGLRDYGIEGQIGLEKHPLEYIAKMVEVCREVKRVLKKTGSLYLNLGDTYFGGGAHHGTKSMGKHATPKVRKQFKTTEEMIGFGQKDWRGLSDGNWLQPKQLMLMPARVAIALQEDGWILRNAIVWYKPNSMPSSVKDRLSNTYEFIFHFCKQRKYFYDLDAIRKPHKVKLPLRSKGSFHNHKQDLVLGQRIQIKANNPKGKNPGDYWNISSKPFPEAHFAVYPPAICRRPIKASCPREICRACGKPRTRITKTSYLVDQSGPKAKAPKMARYKEQGFDPNLARCKFAHGYAKHETVGWSDCGCNARFEPGIVLDPMCGSGTTLIVAQKLGRRWIGIDLNPEYVEMAKKRLMKECSQKLRKWL